MKYELKLYVSGETRNSRKAIRDLEGIFDKGGRRKYKLTIIDLGKSPWLAKRDKVFATPALVKSLPPPARKIIGDLSEKDRVLRRLDMISVVGKGSKKKQTQ